MFTLSNGVLFPTRPFVITIFLLGALYSGTISSKQTDIKRVVAYSSVSHMNLALAGLFTLTSTGLKGAVLYMIAHGLASALLFFLVGFIYERYHTRSLFYFSNHAAHSPFFAVSFVCGNLFNIALPGSLNFIG